MLIYPKRFTIDANTRCWRRPDLSNRAGLSPDIRTIKAPSGWKSRAELLDQHPVTSKPLPDAQWWVIEERLHPRPTV